MAAVAEPIPSTPRPINRAPLGSQPHTLTHLSPTIRFPLPIATSELWSAKIEQSRSPLPPWRRGARLPAIPHGDTTIHRKCEDERNPMVQAAQPEKASSTGDDHQSSPVHEREEEEDKLDSWAPPVSGPANGPARKVEADSPEAASPRRKRTHGSTPTTSPSPAATGPAQ